MIDDSAADGWQENRGGGVYRCPVHVTTGAGGRVAAAAATAPGVTASGSTEAEALAAVTEELKSFAADRMKAAGRVDWSKPSDPPPNAVARYVIVRL